MKFYLTLILASIKLVWFMMFISITWLSPRRDSPHLSRFLPDSPDSSLLYCLMLWHHFRFMFPSIRGDQYVSSFSEPLPNSARFFFRFFFRFFWGHRWRVECHSKMPGILSRFLAISSLLALEGYWISPLRDSWGCSSAARDSLRSLKWKSTHGAPTEDSQGFFCHQPTETNKILF